MDSWGREQRAMQTTMSDLEEISTVVGRLAPKKRAEGVTRLIYENVDGLNNKITNNNKLGKAKDMIDELQDSPWM
jgi:hypothetical protein